MDDEEETCLSGMMSTSPTLSLPNVGHFGTEFNAAGSLPALENLESRVVSTTALDDVAAIPCMGRLQSDNSVDSSAICHSLGATPGQQLAPPVLHRALSTSPRLEHTSESQLLADENCIRLPDSAEETLFFPWASSSQDIDLSSSLPAGQLHGALRFCLDHPKANDSIGVSDTMLSKDNGLPTDNVRKPLVGRVRSGIRGFTRVNSQRNSLTSSISDSQRRLFRLFSRQDSEASAGSLVSKCHGSSIFGSKMFESMSSCSLSSQHVHVVAESAGVYPILSSQYSVDCSVPMRQDDVPAADANGYFDANKPFVPIGVNGHVSSASCINDAQNFGIPGETVTLHRSVSLPSRYNYHGTLAPVAVKTMITENKVVNEKQHDEEAVDNVPELKAASHVVSAAASKRKWQQTMPDLVEGPESDTLTTAGSNRVKLAAAALAIIRGEYNDPIIKEAAQLKETADEATIDIKVERRRYMKNLLVLSSSFFFIFTSFLAIRNLQSSLNAVAGLGLYSLSSLYGFLFVGSLFTTTIVQRLGPKRSLAVSMLSFVAYNVANFIPRFYTLVPLSAVLGFFLAVLWTSHATYVTNIAVGYASLTGAKTSDVLSRFHGIFFAFFQASQIAGGLISSLLLTSSASLSTVGQTNETDVLGEFLYSNHSFNISNIPSEHSKRCGSLYCPSEASAAHRARSEADPNIVLVLMGIFLVSTVAGLVVLIVCLDPLEGIMKKTHASFQTQMTAVFRFFFNRRVVCLLGLPFYSLLQSSFMFGEFTKAFVTCSLGVHMVGFLMLSISLSSGISAYIAGSIQKFVGRMVLNLSAMLLHLVLLFVLFFWYSNKDQLPVFFIIAALWGTSDGILVPQIISLIGTLFVSNKEPAFAAHKMCQSLSAFALFVSAPYLCTKVKIILVGCVLVVAATGYIILEVMLKIEDKKENNETKTPATVCEIKTESIKEPICDTESEDVTS